MKIQSSIIHSCVVRLKGSLYISFYQIHYFLVTVWSRKEVLFQKNVDNAVNDTIIESLFFSKLKYLPEISFQQDLETLIGLHIHLI